MGNQTWTIQRNWQHRVHKTKKNKTKKYNTICVGHHYAYKSRHISMSRLPSANCLPDFSPPENKQNQRTMKLS